MAKKAKGKDYFGLPRIASIILAIIPVTAWILGFFDKTQRRKDSIFPMAFHMALRALSLAYSV